MVTMISPIGNPTPIPEGYFALGGTDIAFDITTTSSYMPPITICLRVDQVDNQTEFNQLRILHEENGQLQDVTVSSDFATRRICAQVNSLSPFRLAIRIDPGLPLITGTVVDSSGATLPNVFVALGGDANPTTITDLAGRFTFANLASGGNYTVTPIDSRYRFVPAFAFVQNSTGTNRLTFTAIPGPNPTLTIAREPSEPGDVIVAWPMEFWPFELESTDDLRPDNWSVVPAPHPIVGNDFVVELPPSGVARFFRLRQH